jgi:probable O-glycosylation ligase (exosortase A-associated)
VRDLVIVLMVVGSIPITLIKPFFGVLVWTWLGLMNPHMLAFGFAANQPFAQIVGVAILVGLALSPGERKVPPMSGITGTLFLFWAWIGFTTIFALNQEYSIERFLLVSKIMLLVVVTMALLTSRLRIISLLWVMVGSIGFYGVKGGVFTLLTGGGERVWGPIGTFIGGNNEIGLALNMVLPLLRYLQLQAQDQRIRIGLFVAIGLTVMAILGTQSRGAAVGLAVTGLWLILKSKRRGPILGLALLVAIPAVIWMPETWHARMDTIDSYEQDGSALGRINAWWAAWYLAQDRVVGAGMGALTTREIMIAYAPNPLDYHDAHSIYFQVLADHGFIGLGLYLTLALTTIATLRSIVVRTRTDPRLAWMTDLAGMINVSLVAFAVAGAFLGLAYFDFMLTEVAVVVAMRTLLHAYEIQGVPEETPTGIFGGRGEVAAVGRSAGRSLQVKVREWFMAL